MRLNLRTWLLSGIRLAILAAVAVPPALAGTASVAWDPVSDPDLAGYRVFVGAAAGSYTQQTDVASTVTSHTVTSLADCTTHFIAVKAFDTVGNLSATYSNEISGWARPTVTGVSPVAAEAGRTLDLVLTGTNFRAAGSVLFSGTGVTVNSVNTTSCTQATVNVTLAAGATTGARSIDYTNPDQTFDTGANLFTVQAQVAPTVSATFPANGATGVAGTVAATASFSEAMNPATITTTNVRLIDAGGAAVPQAAGSPSLSADGLTATITPAATLTAGQTFRIQVVGGASGVADLAGVRLASTSTQATGFTIAGDITAPTLSAVTAGTPGPTSVTITWTTNEASDSQVFYRQTGLTAYQQTAVAPALVTAHSVTLTGLLSDTGYQFHVRSADLAGNATVSTPDGTFTTAVNPYTYLTFEAEAGSLTAPVRAVTATDAFGGRYIDTPAGTPNGSTSNPAGRAVFGVNLPAAGTWRLFVRMYGVSNNNNSWYESMDGAARQQILPGTNNVWQWVLASRTYTFAAGLHSLELGGHESQARADRVILTNDTAFTPTEDPQGDITPPAAPSGLTGSQSDQTASLAWTNPADTDLARVVVRYRSDGVSPVSTADGFGLVDRAASPGAAETATHPGLTSGVTYMYAVFAIDAAGNVSDAARVTVSPADTVPPANVLNLRRTDVR